MDNKKKFDKSLFFGLSSSIGLCFAKLYPKKNFIFYSRKKINIKKNINIEYLDLNKNLSRLPKKADKIFFLASPRYLKKNFSKKKYLIEKKWLKKICKKTKSNTFIYISSGSVYQKKHPIGFAKLQCEKFLQENSNSNYLQIWRPFNILSTEYSNLSDHFHNILIKKFLIEKKRKIIFFGSKNDKRGYSSAKNFCHKVFKYSKKKTSFKYDYGNTKLISVVKIIRLFKDIFDVRMNYKFRSVNKNINVVVKRNNSNINSCENSYKLLKNYYKEYSKKNEN
jgi:nucleoside-diphosphate-sugar epimerase